jgi:hypothetical protein
MCNQFYVQPIFSVYFMGLHLIKGKVAFCTFGKLHVERSRIFSNTRTFIRPIENQEKLSSFLFLFWFPYSSVLFKHAFVL